MRIPAIHSRSRVDTRALALESDDKNSRNGLGHKSPNYNDTPLYGSVGARRNAAELHTSEASGLGHRAVALNVTFTPPLRSQVHGELLFPDCSWMPLVKIAVASFSHFSPICRSYWMREIIRLIHI